MNNSKKDLENKISNKILNQIRTKECTLLVRKSLACIIRIERDAEEHIKKLKLGHLTLKKYLRAEKALENKDWEGLAEITEQIHTEGVPLAITRFWRGPVLLHLNRNEEAILEFERIDGKLDTIEEEASRHWNHVLALYRTGRKNESYELLMKKINPDWPTETFWKAGRFLTEAGFEAFRIKV